MRKFNILLTTIVMAAMLLAACGGEETGTTVPNTTASPEVPQVTLDTTETEEVTGTEPSGTSTEAPIDTTTTPGIPVTGEMTPSRLTNLLDFTVWNQDGEQIGEVDDLVLDLDKTRISYVLVGTGGFLDLGEKEVLVPWDSLEIGTSGDATSGEQNAFTLQTDQETFNNAPDVDVNAILPGVGQQASDWDTEIRTYWESGVAPSGTAAPGTTATIPPAGQATATGTTDDEQSVTLQGAVLASDVLGASVTLSPGQGQGQGQAQSTASSATPQTTATVESGPGVGNFSGNINDMIVDPDTGEILFVVVNTNLEDGERWIPVPLGLFQWDADNETLLLNINPAQLRDAPFFMEDAFPDTTVEGWSSEFDAFWDNLQITP